MTPVFGSGAVKLLRCREGEEFAATLHFLIQTDMEALDAAFSISAWDHDSAQREVHRPTPILAAVEAGHTVKLQSLQDQRFGNGLMTNQRCCAILEFENSLFRQTAIQQVLLMIGCQCQVIEQCRVDAMARLNVCQLSLRYIRRWWKLPMCSFALLTGTRRSVTTEAFLQLLTHIIAGDPHVIGV